MRFFSLFPAYAGVILFQDLLWSGLVPFPRIRGGDPIRLSRFGFIFLLFPAYAGVILNKRYEEGRKPFFSPHTRG